MSGTKTALQTLQSWSETKGLHPKLCTTSPKPGGNEFDQKIIRHPLGIRPAGNALTTDQNLYHNIGFLQKLPEELLQGLLEWLDQGELLALGATCRALYGYTSNDQLWRDICIR